MIILCSSFHQKRLCLQRSFAVAQGNPELIRMLGEIDPHQPYGTELFDALARLTVSIGVEAVCLRLSPSVSRDTRKVDVYMIQRAKNDSAYPGQWHCPGSIMRPGESVSKVFNRLVRKEFDSVGIRSWRFVANVNNFPEVTRGHAFSVVYLCELEAWEGLRGKWFQVNELPDKTNNQHRTRIIPAVLGAFVAEHAEVCKYE